MQRSDLVGTWRLISWENQSADGQISYPFGQDASGYVTYTADGYMFVALMQPGRARFAANDLLGGSAEERAAAARSYLSYGGRYEVFGDNVVHHVEISLFPNWVGVDQMRSIEWDGRRLTLSTAPMLLEGKSQIGRLTWERVTQST